MTTHTDTSTSWSPAWRSNRLLAVTGLALLGGLAATLAMMLAPTTATVGLALAVDFVGMSLVVTFLMHLLDEPTQPSRPEASVPAPPRPAVRDEHGRSARTVATRRQRGEEHGPRPKVPAGQA